MSTSHELRSVMRIEFNFENLSFSGIPESYGSAFGPVENLKRESFIYANRNYVFAIFRERDMKYAVFMRGFEHYESLQGYCVPDVDARLVRHFSCGNYLLEGVFCNAADFLMMALIETLLVVVGSVDDTIARSEIHQVFRTGQVFGFVADSVRSSLHTQKVLILLLT